MSAYALTDSWTMTRRELAHWARQPVQVVVSLVFPVMLLLMFGYLIGGGRAVEGEYVDYLVPGMLALTMAFGLEGTMVAVTQDLNKGVIDRFRSMPMADGAVLVGRSTADMLQSAIGLVVLIGVGLGLGWRPHAGPGQFLGAVGLLLLFRFATTWIGIFLGLLTRSEEAAGQLGGATFILPLLSNAYIPTEGLPGWLRTLAEWNPISAVTTALRDLFGNAPVPEGAAWPVAHPIAGSLMWCAVLLAVFAPLAVRRYAQGEG